MATSLQKARGIVLDVDGTVFSLKLGVGEVYALVLAEEGIEADVAALNDSARRVWRQLLPEYLNEAGGYATTHEREQEFWLRYAARVIKVAGVSAPSSKQSARRVYNAFAREDLRTITPGVLEFVASARAAGIAVLAASNNDVRTKIVLRDLGISERLDGVFVAGDLLWKKPARGYFDALAEKMGLSPGDCAHIGNDPDLDVTAAARAGWLGVRFDPTQRAEGECIASFQDACGVFARR
jgi:putative hydrolase of the HAD superfamily